MSALRTVAISCDKPGCGERWLGGPSQPASRVRREAAHLGGWTAHRIAVDQTSTIRDLCRWHS